MTCCRDYEVNHNQGYIQDRQGVKGRVILVNEIGWSDLKRHFTLQYCPWCGEKVEQ